MGRAVRSPRPRSPRPPLTQTGKAIDGKILYHFIQLKNCVIGKCYTSSPYTRRLLEKEKRFFCVRCFSKKLSLSCGRKGIDETPPCDKHEEAQQPPAESEVYTACGRLGNLFHYQRYKCRSYVAVYINYEVNNNSFGWDE